MTTVQTNAFGSILVLETWEEIGSAIQSGSIVYMGDGIIIFGMDKSNGVWRYHAKDRYMVDCFVYEDGRVTGSRNVERITPSIPAREVPPSLPRSLPIPRREFVAC